MGYYIYCTRCCYRTSSLFDDSHVLGDLNWHRKGIVVLPPSIGNLTVGGALHLRDNQLISLPESFGSLSVGGALDLHNNQLESLPESFGSLTVGGDLYLLTGVAPGVVW